MSWDSNSEFGRTVVEAILRYLENEGAHTPEELAGALNYDLRCIRATISTLRLRGSIMCVGKSERAKPRRGRGEFCWAFVPEHMRTTSRKKLTATASHQRSKSSGSGQIAGRIVIRGSCWNPWRSTPSTYGRVE